MIYSIEKERITGQRERSSIDLEDGREASERTALISENPIELENQQFIDALNKSLDKIVKFYAKKETELYDEMNMLLEDFEQLETQGTPSHSRRLSHQEAGRIRSNTNQLPRRESNVEGDSFLPPNIISKNVIENDPAVAESTYVQRSWPKDMAYDVVELKRRIVDLFVLLSELKSFVALNLTAFAKILKKYDKITNNNLKKYYTATYVSQAYPFETNTKARLNERIQQSERAYAFLATDNDLDQAIEELKAHLREHIVWERNTVWRDMIGQERRTQTVGLSDVKPSPIHTPFGMLNVARDQVMNYLYMAASVAIFILLLRAELFDTVEQNRCLAILVFASMLWAGEVRLSLFFLLR